MPCEFEISVTYFQCQLYSRCLSRERSNPRLCYTEEYPSDIRYGVLFGELPRTKDAIHPPSAILARVQSRWVLSLLVSRFSLLCNRFSFLIMGKTKATNFLRLITFGLGIIFTVAYSPLSHRRHAGKIL